MAGAKFQYDENGSIYYFLLAFEAVVIIPCTFYYFVSKRETRSSNEKDKICRCDNCAIKNSRLRTKGPWVKTKQTLIQFLLLIAWGMLFLTFYKVTNLTHETVSFDPYEVLQIVPDASTAEIKKAYRKLSLQHHPDKSGGDEKQFMLIAKAYSALTQDEARKNFELYGDPDGPGATSFGIALPSWIVDQENSIVVLGIYTLLFMIVLPSAVGFWWYKSMNKFTEDVFIVTIKLYNSYIGTTPHMTFKRVIMIIAASLEFYHAYNKEIIERPSDNVEVPNLIKELASFGLNEKNRERPLCFAYSIKARALIFAHLSRFKLSPTLDEDKLTVIKKCPVLIAEFVSCTARGTLFALAGKMQRMPSLDTLENAIKLSQCIVQAMWNHQNSMLQLPHLTEDMLKYFVTRKRNIRSIWHLASMQDDDRRALLRSLTDDQYQDVINVISNMPLITLSVKSEILGEEDNYKITAGALVTVTVTLVRENMSTLFKTKEVKMDKVNENDEEKPIANGTESVKKPPVWMKQKKKKSSVKPKVSSARAKKLANKNLPKESTNEDAKEKDPNAIDESDTDNESEKESPEPANEEDDDDMDDSWLQYKKKDKIFHEKKESKLTKLVHCPFFPDNKREGWWLYISDKKKHVLITNPFLVTTFIDKEDIELKFIAPLKPGLYSYAISVRSDSYIDFDLVKVLHIEVQAAEPPQEIPEISDVEEEEEEKERMEDSAFEDSDLMSDDDRKND